LRGSFVWRLDKVPHNVEVLAKCIPPRGILPLKIKATTYFSGCGNALDEWF
jgi:hypothetical protein